MFSRLYYAVMRESFVSPLAVSTVGSGLVICGLYLWEANDWPQYGGLHFARTNKLPPHETLLHELQAEMHNLLRTPYDQISDHQRAVYSNLGTVKKYYDQLEDSSVSRTPDEVELLKKKFQAASLDVFYKFANARNILHTPEECEELKKSFYEVNNIPFSYSEPITELLPPRAQDVPVPAPGSPRQEYVNYYARKWDL